MNKYILFIFEGEKTEPMLWKNVKSNFFTASEKDTVFIYTTYKAEIMQLWNKIKTEYGCNDYIDLVTILKDRGNHALDNAPTIFSEIHLFFDYDAQSCPSTMSIHEYNTRISEMLDYFNNEDENGKLWVSYPMVESVKHCKRNANTCFGHCIVDIHIKDGYKKLVDKESDYLDVRKYKREDWYYFIAIAVQKAGCLVNDCYKTPNYKEAGILWEQVSIHKKQTEKFIIPASAVAVLSAFPAFLLYYFGETLYAEVLKNMNLVKKCCFSCLCAAEKQ